jgi:hypothetical protein
MVCGIAKPIKAIMLCFNDVKTLNMKTTIYTKIELYAIDGQSVMGLKTS